jgi:hypothetical protein
VNIGLILPDLNPSQLSFEIINLINANSKKNEYVVFYENITRNMNSISCPVMNISEVKYFRSGLLVAFNLHSALSLLNSFNDIQKLLYLYDLEWVRGKTDYLKNLKIMRNLPLATRSREYSLLIENYCNSHCEVQTLEDILCNKKEKI